MSGRRNHSRYVGRFAPSPTGDLHFGSLVAAVASFLDARIQSGRWLVRIEDLDPPREVAGSAERILADLERLDMKSDGPVLFQSSRRTAYADAVDFLLERNLAYWCGCSRGEVPPDGVYPGTCSHGLPRGRKPRAVRLRISRGPITFVDRIRGEISCDLSETCGDFVILRADGLAAYQLAVVIDDAFQQVTDVVRGSDLLDSTARQIHLQRCLRLPSPAYAHIPIALGADGKKLSKRFGSDPIHLADGAGTVRQALAFLGHETSEPDLADVWSWARRNWSLARVPNVTGLPWPPALSG